MEREKNSKAFSPQSPSLFPFFPVPYPFRRALRRLIFLFAPKHTDAREKKTPGIKGSQSSKTGPIFVKRPKTYWHRKLIKFSTVLGAAQELGFAAKFSSVLYSLLTCTVENMGGLNFL